MAVTASIAEIDPAGWLKRLDELFTEVVAPFFCRREPRLRARSYLLGLLSGLERKNGWSLAEFAGDSTPDGMQRLLSQAVWDADRVREALRRHAARRVGFAGGVLFDSGNHPGITFSADGIRPSGQDVAVTGTLTVGDSTRPTRMEGARMPTSNLYDAIGVSYPAKGRTEPRIAAWIWAVPGDARTVLKGLYEPPGRDVTAVAPSAVMRARRSPHGTALQVYPLR